MLNEMKYANGNSAIVNQWERMMKIPNKVNFRYEAISNLKKFYFQNQLNFFLSRQNWKIYYIF